ncbi:uncharacterized protein CheA87a [Eurosta solidaginis]|uniref:uncharacterized protein CheA87a n=1 Tax=Eurosta solidaginis TaxID=178769 RepID=UPI00353135F7
MEFNLLIFNLMLCGFFAITSFAEEQKKFKFILDNVITEKESEDVGKIKVELDKSGDYLKINGEAEQLVDLDNTWKVQIVLKGANEANEEFKERLTLPLLGVCDFMKFYYKMYIYESLVKYANAPAPNVCPVVKDTYVLRDYPLVSEKFQKFLQPGFYRMEASLYHEEEEKIKYSVEGHVVEEE